MSLNGGRDEKSGAQVGPAREPYSGEVLDYGEVLERMDFYREWLARTYVKAMNRIRKDADGAS